MLPIVDDVERRAGEAGQQIPPAQAIAIQFGHKKTEAYRSDGAAGSKIPTANLQKVSDGQNTLASAVFASMTLAEDLVVSTPSSSCEQSASTEQTRWFVEEVHAHDAALKNYPTRARARPLS